MTDWLAPEKMQHLFSSEGVLGLLLSFPVSFFWPEDEPTLRAPVFIGPLHLFFSLLHLLFCWLIYQTWEKHAK